MVENNQASSEGEFRCLEQIIGCKWSLSVITAVGRGVSRPGALQREIEGISNKVLSERLRKLTNYGLLDKQKYLESPPRTEYSLTCKGQKLAEIVDQIRALDQSASPAQGSPELLAKEG